MLFKLIFVQYVLKLVSPPLACTIYRAREIALVSMFVLIFLFLKLQHPKPSPLSRTVFLI